MTLAISASFLEALAYSSRSALITSLSNFDSVFLYFSVSIPLGITLYLSLVKYYFDFSEKTISMSRIGASKKRINSRIYLFIPDA